MITLILPYYRQTNILLAQLDVIDQYPDGLRVIVVDDGSPEPAKDVIGVLGLKSRKDYLSLYRINEDIPWNRGEARNLGAYVATTDWIIQADIDHILPAECAERLVNMSLRGHSWYRFPRFRVGKADSTRKKDLIPETQDFGAVKPHQDSYLIPRTMFLSRPYDERYSGCLGGGTPFLTIMEAAYGAPKLLPEDIFLFVYTSDKIPDASITTLSRDTSEYARRREKFGDVPPTKMLLHPWHKVL